MKPNYHSVLKLILTIFEFDFFVISKPARCDSYDTTES